MEYNFDNLNLQDSIYNFTNMNMKKIRQITLMKMEKY